MWVRTLRRVTIPPTAADIDAWLNTAPNRERSGVFRDLQVEGVRRVVALLPPVPAPCTVAGTKGKGSTVRLIESALVAAGQPTVAFTSPHVASVLERWRVDGRPAHAAAVALACEKVAALERQHHLALTYFERTFAVACLLAGQRPGTRFIVEVGLGGRLDCANALDCAIAVITHLSHDHRDVLGPTLHHIAREKLAVSRPDAPLVIAPQTPAAALALARLVPAFRASAVEPQRSLRINLRPAAPTVWAQSPRLPFDLTLPGDHQQDNAATAAAALALWAPEVDATTMRRGFAAAALAARCQVVEHSGRTLLIDGAHNRESIAATLVVARRRLRAGWRLIIGLAGDKEVDEIMQVIPPGLPVTRCGYDSLRARRVEQWPRAAQEWRWCDHIGEALAIQPPQADLCITGSFYLAGEALTHLGHAGELPG
jgi:dihydrofolate synthase/folylpolyglutamate synthase